MGDTEPKEHSCCGARPAVVEGGVGLAVGETDGKEVSLIVTVGCHEGTMFLSEEMWREIGRRGGWTDKTQRIR